MGVEKEGIRKINSLGSFCAILGLLVLGREKNGGIDGCRDAMEDTIVGPRDYLNCNGLSAAELVKRYDHGGFLRLRFRLLRRVFSLRRVGLVGRVAFPFRHDVWCGYWCR